MPDVRRRGPAMVFTAFVILTFYSLGAGYVESFVNYPLWHVIGSTDRWIDYHRALGPRIIVVLAIPALALSLAANLLLLFFRPRAVPMWSIVTALVLLIVAAVSTMTVQIPIQAKLDAGYDRAAVDTLMATSLWLRDVTGGLRAAIVAYMVHLSVSAAQ